MIDDKDAQYIRNAVAWLYRTQIKDPRDTVEEIAAQEGVPVAHVEAAIAEADRLLNAVTPDVLAKVEQRMSKSMSDKFGRGKHTPRKKPQ